MDESGSWFSRNELLFLFIVFIHLEADLGLSFFIQGWDGWITEAADLLCFFYTPLVIKVIVLKLLLILL